MAFESQEEPGTHGRIPTTGRGATAIEAVGPAPMEPALIQEEAEAAAHGVAEAAAAAEAVVLRPQSADATLTAKRRTAHLKEVGTMSGTSALWLKMSSALRGCQPMSLRASEATKPSVQAPNISVPGLVVWIRRGPSRGVGQTVILQMATCADIALSATQNGRIDQRISIPCRTVSGAT